MGPSRTSLARVLSLTGLVAVATLVSGTSAAEPTAPPAPKSAPAKPAPAPAKPPTPKAPTTKASRKATGTTAATNLTVARERSQDPTVRRSVAGGPTLDDVAAGADTPELRALHAAERELFPPASSAGFSPWPQDLPFPVAAPEDRPRVHASGVPPEPVPSSPLGGDKELEAFAKLDMPELPIRWDPRVVRYLSFFKDDPRGRATFTIWLRRSGRYRDAIKKALRQKGLPEDLACLAMIESGFEPTARSPVGAAGLWQFMPETGKIYGLYLDRWADQRMSVTASTDAAADFLADLHRRFGSWDLAMAAYNMGYGGMLSVVRRYNTNDFWALARLEGSLPWETTLYVPKILAASIVMRNLAAFGFDGVQVEPAIEIEDVKVPPGTAVATIAQTCGVPAKDIEVRNPDLRAQRTPPTTEWTVKLPPGKAETCAGALARGKRETVETERYVVRFGESLEQIAEAHGIGTAKLVEMNGIAQGEVVRGGTVLLVPKDAKPAAPKADPKRTARLDPVVVVPPDVFVYPDRKRVFYKVQIADTIRDVAQAVGVSVDDLRRWNGVDPQARLVEGMTLQAFVAKDADLSRVVTLDERNVRVVVSGSEEFFQQFDEKGRQRLVVTAKPGDTLEAIGKKHGVSVAMMERINRRGRKEALAEGDRVVVWTGQGHADPAPTNPQGAKTPDGQLASNPPAGAALEPAKTAPLGTPPAADLLPALP